MFDMETEGNDETATALESVPERQAMKGERRQGGHAVGETFTHPDGFQIRVDRLGLLPQEPPQSFFDKDKFYVSSEAVRFEVTVTNDGDETASLSDLNIRVRTGPEGRPSDEAWDGTRVLRGKLLPGASATGTFTYRILAGTAGEIDVAVTRGHYTSDEKTQQVWTGGAVPGLYGQDAAPQKGGLTPERREELFAEAMKDLDAMSGLAPVKRRVRILGAYARMSAVRARHQLPQGTAARHLVFSGHPGTGKTEVARLLGKVFAGAGLLEKGHLVEAHRVDLIGEHLGHTAVKTNELIDSALDGVLFIDEAYGLHAANSYGNVNAFGDEALQILLKRAEDDRRRLVVILAGYGKEMDQLLGANPGLASRFATRVDFPSYDGSELLSIAQSMIAAGRDRVNAAAVAELVDICAAVECNDWQDVLGNGRFARTLTEHARDARDLRLAERYRRSDPPVRQLTQLAAVDFRAAFADIQSGYGLRPVAAAA